MGRRRRKNRRAAAGGSPPDTTRDAPTAPEEADASHTTPQAQTNASDPEAEGEEEIREWVLSTLSQIGDMSRAEISEENFVLSWDASDFIATRAVLRYRITLHFDRMGRYRVLEFVDLLAKKVVAARITRAEDAKKLELLSRSTATPRS